MKIRNVTASLVLASTALLLGLLFSSAHAASGLSQLDGLHARALESFRQGRFPEAYGRFMESAELGHPASAGYALFMCEHGLELFGKDWDCAQFQVDAWATAARVAAPTIRARVYPPQPRPRAAGLAQSNR